MSREVRITIDDDEVFERMKRRKNELDLSWEDVLHRGLRKTSDGDESERGRSRASDESDFQWEPEEAVRALRGEPSEHATRRPSGESESIGDIVEEFRRHVRGQVRDSLRESMKSMRESRSDLEREVGALENAEDAELVFDSLEDRRAYRVPLRVTLQTSRRGLDVEVVAVRQGKSVSGMNRFDREARRTVNEHLARGETATLVFDDGDESYDVAPLLSWSRDKSDAPTVASVEIDEVIFDDEN